MALSTPPFATQGGVYPAALDRVHLVTATHLRASTGDGAREGFFPDRYPVLSSAGMDVTISSFAGVVANDFAAGGGDYLIINQGNVTVSLAASSPTQNRRDLIGFQIRDNAYDASGLNTVVPAVVQGAYSNGVAVAPAAPAGFTPVTEAQVDAGVTTPVLSSARTRTVASGGVLPIVSAAERTAVGTIGQGVVALRLDGNRIEWQNSTGGWHIVTLPVVSSAAQLSTVVTHPTENMVVVVADIPALYVYRGGVWMQWESARPHAKVWRTAGFTTLTAPGVIIPMNAGRARGGMVVVANGSTNSVTLPVAGFYRVEVRPFASGATGYYQFNANRQRVSVTDIPIMSAQFPKTTADDLGGLSSVDEIPLAAGDVVYLSAASSTGTGTTWGTSEIRGVSLTVTYVRALEGATPV